MKNQLIWLPVMAFVFQGLAVATTPKGAKEEPFLKKCNAFSVSGHSANKGLDAFLDMHWKYRMTEFPEEATWNGYPGQNDRWTDLSRAAIERRKAELLCVSKALAKIGRGRLDNAHQVSYDVFKFDLDSELEGLKFPTEVLQLNQLNGVHIDVSQLMGAAPASSVKEYEDIVLRLERLPQKIDQTIDLLKEGLSQKVTPPQITLRDVPDQIKALLVDDLSTNPLLTPFTKFPSAINEADQKTLKDRARKVFSTQVKPAYQRLLSFVVTVYMPGATTVTGWKGLPRGADWYALLVKKNTTTTMTPQEIHEVGLSEVKRIRSEMDEIIKKVEFKGDFKKFSEFLNKDKRFFFSSREELLRYVRDIAKRIDPELSKMFGKLPRMPYGVVAVPEYSEKSQPGGYYEPGSVSAGRPGTVYINTYDLSTRASWGFETLMAHEGVPGHHLQTAIAGELEGVPEFRKFNWYTAYGEGWALYSESLGAELGLYKDPYSKFGNLSDEMMRAIRLVVDTGMHSLGWSRDQAIDFFKQNSPMSEHEIIVETDRYLVWPGQALGYKVGQLKIKALREKWTKELGEKFDLRGFHDTVLANGNVPLAVLESQLEVWAKAQRKKKPTPV